MGLSIDQLKALEGEVVHPVLDLAAKLFPAVSTFGYPLEQAVETALDLAEKFHEAFARRTTPTKK